MFIVNIFAGESVLLDFSFFSEESNLLEIHLYYYRFNTYNAVDGNRARATHFLYNL